MKPLIKQLLKLIILSIIIIVFIYILYYIYNNGQSSLGEPESNNKYISSRGILKSCDVYSNNPTSSITSYDIDINKIKTNSVVYITGSAIPSFAKDLDKINVRFILVSGDCDESIPDMIFNDNDFIKFIESDKIICWFTQNCVKEHPKLIPIPIGLDYHTLAKKSMSWGKKQSPKAQEDSLLSIKNNSKTFNLRKIMCYSNFHFNKSVLSKFTYDRDDAIKQVPKDLVFYEPVAIEREKSWKNQSEYAFVLSPHGNGLDCHRTWEALCLGCIPIVKTSPIDNLYNNLPVLIVNDWFDITHDLLEETIIKFKETHFDYSKLTLAYWTYIIRNKLK